MAVTEVSPADRAAINAEVDRLTQSSVLHGSEALCRLLRYLAGQALAHPGVPVKEYQLATEVFGRPADFDPRMDSTVRVQTGRLRSKLAEYYPSAGADDPIVLEIPKGSYSLVFHYRAAAPAVKYEPASGAAIAETASGARASGLAGRCRAQPAGPGRLDPGGFEPGVRRALDCSVGLGTAAGPGTGQGGCAVRTAPDLLGAVPPGSGDALDHF